MDIKEIQIEKYPEYVDGIPIGTIIRSIAGIRYGYVQIIIQDSRVVQVDKLDKTRFEEQRRKED